MGSFKRPRVFQPLDLEIMDRVYETVWVHLEACEPFRDRQKDGELLCPTPGWCSRVVSLIGHQKSAHKF